jgi:hypothetical protein
MKKNDNVSQYFKRLYADNIFEISACDGTRTIAGAKNVFKKGMYLNGTFLSSSCPKTELVKIDCHQLIKKTDSPVIFKAFCKNVDNLKEIMFTQHQVVEISEKYLLNSLKLLLKKIISIPFKDNNEYFIADIEVFSNGLDIYIYGFEYITAWYAVNRRHLIVPTI